MLQLDNYINELERPFRLTENDLVDLNEATTENSQPVKRRRLQ